MNGTARLAAAALAVLLAAGAGKPPPTPESQLLSADRAFSSLSAQRGQSYAAFVTMTNDARLYGSGGETAVIGKAQAFRRLGRRESGTLSRQPQTARVSGDGRMGWTSGRWLLVAQGGRQRRGGNYLTVWVKDRAGAWKIQSDMGTTDPAPKK